MVGWHYQLDEHEFEQALGVGEGQGSLVFCSPAAAKSLQLCPALCEPMNSCSTPGFPVHHQLPEFAQTHVHQVGDATQPSDPLSFSFPPAFSLSQHRGLFQ